MQKAEKMYSFSVLNFLIAFLTLIFYLTFVQHKLLDDAQLVPLTPNFVFINSCQI